jgi:hypothetical protein
MLDGPDREAEYGFNSEYCGDLRFARLDQRHCRWSLLGWHPVKPDRIARSEPVSEDRSFHNAAAGSAAGGSSCFGTGRLGDPPGHDVRHHPALRDPSALRGSQTDALPWRELLALGEAPAIERVVGRRLSGLERWIVRSGGRGQEQDYGEDGAAHRHLPCNRLMVCLAAECVKRRCAE